MTSHGDHWLCAACGYYSYDAYSTCFKCKAPRPSSSAPRTPTGDFWSCTLCESSPCKCGARQAGTDPETPDAREVTREDIAARLFELADAALTERARTVLMIAAHQLEADHREQLRAQPAKSPPVAVATPTALPTVEEIRELVERYRATRPWEPVLREEAMRLVETLHAAAELADEATYIINEIADDEDCRLDHHGYCQEHLSFTEKCLNVRALEWLARDKERRTRSGQHHSSEAK